MNPDEIEQMRARIVAEAKTWIGTRYHHLADVKGIGVDCAMLLIRCYCDVGAVPLFDPRPYEPEWYLHQDEALYMAGMEKYAHRIDVSDARPADILMYKFGRHAAHGAIVLDSEFMIHAYRTHGNVESCERRSFEHRLDSAWSIFP